MRGTLERWGVPLDGVELHDGSGLSRNNRATCAALSAVLATAPVAPTLRRLLPAAGRDGTLSEELLGTPAEGELVAKSGTLTDVKALTGVQASGAGDDVNFSLILNAPAADEPSVYRPAWEAMLELIESYPIVVEPDAGRFEPVTG